MSSTGKPGYYIGLISGTSVDAIDCALIETGRSGTQLIAHHVGHFQGELRQRILELCSNPHTSLLSLGELHVEIGQLFADCVTALLMQEGLSANQIVAIGSHGQTVFHHPYGEFGFSLQIGDPNTIAQRTGITTVADFRQRDIVAGGQGAPLAPLFHQHFFHSPTRCRAIVNIGGMANITWLDEQQTGIPRGFDTGPGNVLMDGWIQRHLQHNYDADGKWAETGAVLPELLRQMLAEDYFSLPAPKSTGRELFNLAWLDAHLIRAALAPTVAPQDIQRTLLELTAISISEAVESSRPINTDLPNDLLVCGGGAHNRYLMARLQQLLPDFEVASTQRFDLDPDWVEAATFAWLASQTLARQHFDSAVLTGARSPVILGGVYYGK